jgi:hypothetical protein
MTVMTNGAHHCNCKDTRSYLELAIAEARIQELFRRLELGEPSLTAPLTYEQPCKSAGDVTWEYPCKHMPEQSPQQQSDALPTKGMKGTPTLTKQQWVTMQRIYLLGIPDPRQPSSSTWYLVECSPSYVSITYAHCHSNEPSVLG